MLKDGKILIAKDENGEDICLLPGRSNRHGLIAGATGTGKTVTLKVLAEGFSEMGVPVFLADVKGDLAGMCSKGSGMESRLDKLGIAPADFEYTSYPTAYWDIYGKTGIPLRTTITEMGPLLLSRILDLNELQSDILSIAFKIADDEGLVLTDTKDLKALLNYISENNKDFAQEYGKMSPVSISAILRSVVAMEMDGGETFFAEPALDISDFLRTKDGKGYINILDSSSLIQNGTLYSMFLLWMLSELFENMPEVGDPEKPKMVFFFDEAHLLFKDTPKALLDKIEQVVKLIRSKGIGIFFITQNPRDIPDGVLAQLGNKIEHALHAYTPSDQKAVRAAADSFRANPAFDTFEAIQSLGTGEAVISLLDDEGVPTIAHKCMVLPPQSMLGSVDERTRESVYTGLSLYKNYKDMVDDFSAYEFLTRRGMEAEAAALKAKEEAEKAKEKEKAEKEAEKEKEKAKKAEEARKKRAAKAVGNSVAGTVGREVGKTVGSSFGKFGKTLGGNVGASLGRGLFGTLFKL
ncbi:helicase HerA-like domain-containing protein [Butyrivibrio sp. MC2013]|uniref:helicase HerA-like domain-containing protein n=1 Tax=Butyrivibrio sp. MC2013 TaxID=1280686 RepID=UPI0004107F32|nr:helicase HerA-like domain-containing protein [Butyrivibrio sp. MC2013]